MRSAAISGDVGDDRAKIRRVDVLERPSGPERPQRPSSLRLTRRGRLVAFGASLVAVLGLGFAAASGSLANDKSEPTRVITVQPNQTLWDIASRASYGGDVRSTMAHLEAINHLDSSTLQVGQHLRVPK